MIRHGDALAFTQMHLQMHVQLECYRDVYLYLCKQNMYLHISYAHNESVKR